MGIAVELVDGVVSKLNESTFGTATVERQLLPEVERKGLTPRIIVTLEGKESFELDRGNESIRYKVAVGLSYPTTSVADLDDGLDMIEAIQDWLALKSNRTITTASGSFKLLQPIEMANPFDSAMAQEASLFFSVLTIPYIFYKIRN